MKRTLVLCLFFLVCSVFPATVYLQNPGATARQAEPVTFGIPIKQGELPNIVMGGDAPLSLSGIPAQFRVTSRWYDNSARWVLATLLTDFTASENKALDFVKGSGSASSTNLRVTQNSDTLWMETGVIKVEILKGARFNLINRIWRGTDLVVDNTGMKGLVLKPDTANGDTSEFIARALTDSIVIEEQGPVRAMVYAAGRFFSGPDSILSARDPGDQCHTSLNNPLPAIRFMVRISVYDSKDEIAVSTVLHNTGTNGLQNAGAGSGYPKDMTFDDSTSKQFYGCDYYSQFLYFRSLYYDLKMNLNAPRTVTTEGGTFSAVPSAGKVSFLQASPNNYYVFHDGALAGQGGRGDGYLDVTDGTKGIGAAYKFCWEAYPKRFDVIGDTFRVNLFPRDIAPADTYFTTYQDWYTVNSGKWTKCYVAPGGVWLRDDVFFSVHGASFDAGSFAAARKNPVVPKYEDSYLHGTKAIQGFYSDTLRFLEPLGSLEQRTFERKRIWSGIMYDYNMTEGNDMRQSLREYWEDTPRLSYGPLNAGDIQWGDDFCNLHYDQLGGVMNSFLRTGSYKAWKVAELMGYHRSNITTYHNIGLVINGGLSRYEKDDHDNGWVSPRTSHHWCEGLGLYSALTGDPFARESFREGVEGCFWYFVYRFGRQPPLTQNFITTELRSFGWPILNLVAGYTILGDEKYYQMLRLMFHNAAIPTEEYEGPGFTLVTDSIDIFQGYLSTPLVHMYDALKPEDTGLRDSLKQLLGRMWVTVEGATLFPGEIRNDTIYFPRSIGTYINGMDEMDLTDWCGFAWKVLGVPEAKTLGFMHLLRVAGYHAYDSKAPVDAYQPAVFRSHQYPGSETKLHGKIGLFGRKLLEYEYDRLQPIGPDDGAIAAEGRGTEAQDDISLSACPNPFNPSVTIRVQGVHGRQEFRVNIYDVQGKKISGMSQIPDNGGAAHIVWNGRNSSGKEAGSGVYFIRAAVGNQWTRILKLTKLK